MTSQRASGVKTSCYLARADSTLCIFASPPLASCRLGSNVRPESKHFRANP